MCINGCHEGGWLARRTASLWRVLPDYYLSARPLSLRCSRRVRRRTRHACPYVVPVPSWSLRNPSRMSPIAVRLYLICSRRSSRWCCARLTSNSSARPSTLSSHRSISNFSPSIVSEWSSNLSNSAWETHSTLPSNWTSPGLGHSPSAMRIQPISQRDCWSAECSLVSTSWATGARSFRLGLSTSPVNGTRPKARVDGGSTPWLFGGFGPSKAPTFRGSAYRSTCAHPHREG